MADTPVPYRVLARKYRPKNFDELVGQDALVRTLKNAITSGRVAHAFILTGVRGVGKTTSARIIAKALNYAGPDGTAGPTTGPTDDCPICRAITEDRHPDVMEMDAASRTGVDDIREILDALRYAPIEARYKVYIIDEVHMLSKNAFNALLKTLEEPPAHVKFIFATTEIRKVPVTILSRCQRFDLQRVSPEVLAAHYAQICTLEQVEAQSEALSLIARAADGSVRDGLSVLDQAIALGGARVDVQLVRDMLGLTERGRTMDLLSRALRGDIAGALAVMDDLSRAGALPLMIMQDLLELTHGLTKIRAVPNLQGLEQAYAADELMRMREMAQSLSMPTLGKAWQILLKGLSEVQEAPNPQGAAEMILIRLVYAVDLPDPADLLRRLKDGGLPAGPVPSASAAPMPTESAPPPVYAKVVGGSSEEPRAMMNPQIMPVVQSGAVPTTLEGIIAALEAQGEMRLASEMYHVIHPVRIEEVFTADNPHIRFELRLAEGANPKLPQDIAAALSRVTGIRWVLTLVNVGGAPTLAQQAQDSRQAALNAAAAHPIVAEILKIFPEGRLVKVYKTDETLS